MNSANLLKGLFMAVIGLGLFLTTGSQARAATGLLGVKLIEDNGTVVINVVISGTSAEKVGIQPGDILAKVGTTDISSIQDALDAKNAAKEGVDVPFVIRTPNGNWPINARFGGEGQPYAAYSANTPRPKPKSPKPPGPNPLRP